MALSDGFCLGHPNAHLWGMYWNVGVPPACAFLHRDKTRDHFRSLSHSGELPATFRPTVAYVSSSGPARYIGETGPAFPAVSAAERQIQTLPTPSKITRDHEFITVTGGGGGSVVHLSQTLSLGDQHPNILRYVGMLKPIRIAFPLDLALRGGDGRKSWSSFADVTRWTR